MSPDELRKERRRQRNARQNELRAANREAFNARQNERNAANREARNARQNELRVGIREDRNARQNEVRAGNREDRNARQNELNVPNRQARNARQNELRSNRRIDLEKQREELVAKSKLNDETFIVSEEELKFASECISKQQENRNSLDTSDVYFSDIESSPVKSVLLFYINSGCTRFGEYKWFDESLNNTPVDQDKLDEEVGKEKLNDKEIAEMVSKFDLQLVP